MSDSAWQGLRRYAENTLVVEDWFEVFIAQDVVLDTLVYDLMYRQFDHVITEAGGGDLAMLIEFMQEWHKDNSRWVDATLKSTIAESEHNREQIRTWVTDWQEKAIADLAPLADIAVGEQAISECVDVLGKRLAKAGL